jgi:enoyl-CoA hydratase/3-hydroxyacyl-CoA dehydrogenase
MGSGIAQKMATEGFDVILVDVDDAKVARGMDSIERTLKEAVERSIMRADKTAAIRARLRGTARFEDLHDADLVVEAVFENLTIKRDVFARLESVCRPDAILATNTSSYLVTDIASAVRTPERVLGLHYFFHPAKNRLVEVVPAKATASSTFERGWALQEQLGKIPIASKDACGFVVNRFFVVWLMEAIRMLDEGVANAATIDDLSKRAFGVGMGPFELMNVTGVPIALHAATTIGDASGPLYGPPDSLRKQVESGQPWPLSGEVNPAAEKNISDRLMAGVFLAAGALVAEDVGTITDVDIGARVGLRWPRGPFELMNRAGTARALQLVRELAARWKMSVPAFLTKAGALNEPVPIELVRALRDNGVSTVTVNRPDAMNALNENVGEQIETLFTQAAREAGTRGIVIAGSGRSFVAGADIRFFIRNIESDNIAHIRRFTEDLQGLLMAIQNCSKPVVARIHGLALGGGVELALACDYIAATPNASMGFPETGIGIYPGLGGTQRTSRRIGSGLTKWLVFTGQIISAEEARAIGLVDAVVPREQLDDAIGKLIAQGVPAERRQADPPEAYRKLAEFFENNDVEAIRLGRADTQGNEQLEKAMKAVGTKAPIALKIAAALIDEGSRVPLEKGLRMELSHLEEIFATKDALTGLRSIGKAHPVFEGA